MVYENNYDDIMEIADELEAGGVEEEGGSDEENGTTDEEDSGTDDAVDQGQSSESEDGEHEDEQDSDSTHQEEENSDGVTAAPEHWSEEDKAAFDAAPQELKDWALRRDKQMEASFTKKTQELAEQQREVEPFVNTAKAHGEYFNQLGVQPSDAINILVDAEKTLRFGSPQDKVNKFVQLAKDYGVDLSNVGSGQGVQNQEGENADFSGNPQIQAISSEMSQLRQVIENNERNEIVRQVEDFKNEVDDNGELKYPHFEAVKVEMGMQISANPKLTMADAYKRAVKLDDNIQAEIAKKQAEKAKEKEEAERLERQKKAADAKKAKVVSTKKGTSTAKPTKKYATLEDEIMDIANDLEAAS